MCIIISEGGKGFPTSEKERVMFRYVVKTTVKNDHFTAIAWGTKRDMLRFAREFDKHQSTIESRIVRDKDGAVVYNYMK